MREKRLRALTISIGLCIVLALPALVSAYDPNYVIYDPSTNTYIVHPTWTDDTANLKDTFDAAVSTRSVCANIGDVSGTMTVTIDTDEYINEFSVGRVISNQFVQVEVNFEIIHTAQNIYAYLEVNGAKVRESNGMTYFFGYTIDVNEAGSSINIEAYAEAYIDDILHTWQVNGHISVLQQPGIPIGYIIIVAVVIGAVVVIGFIRRRRKGQDYADLVVVTP